jgi:hypothetical protein
VVKILLANEFALDLGDAPAGGTRAPRCPPNDALCTSCHRWTYLYIVCSTVDDAIERTVRPLLRPPRHGHIGAGRREGSRGLLARRKRVVHDSAPRPVHIRRTGRDSRSVQRHEFETGGYMSNDIDTVMGLAETAALSELSSPEAVAAFALIRSRLRPGQPNRYAELAATVDRLSGPRLAESADAELTDALRTVTRSASVDELVRSAREPIAKLALAQILRDRSRESSGRTDLS